jgi:hypothetical protein
LAGGFLPCQVAAADESRIPFSRDFGLLLSARLSEYVSYGVAEVLANRNRVTTASLQVRQACIAIDAMTITLTFAVLVFVFAVPDRFAELLWRDSPRGFSNPTVHAEPNAAGARSGNEQTPIAGFEGKYLQDQNCRSIIRRFPK